MSDPTTTLDVEQSQVTTDHSTVRRWAERREGHPTLASDDDAEPGALQFRFGAPEDDPESIPWERFFRQFDEENLAFVYAEQGFDGDTNRYYEFVDRSSL